MTVSAYAAGARPAAEARPGAYLPLRKQAMAVRTFLAPATKPGSATNPSGPTAVPAAQEPGR